MIKTARKKFVLTTMLILLGVFLFISFASCYIIDRIHSTNVKNTLDNTYKTFNLIKDNPPSNDVVPAKGIIAFIIDKDNLAFYALIDEDTYTKFEAETIIKQAIESKSSKGRIKNVYFRFYRLDVNNSEIAVASDMTESLNMRKNYFLRIFILFLSIYGLLFLAVMLISEKIFKPIKDNLEKQRQFISDASHELKTPITIISANTEVLREVDSNQWLENIKAQTKRLETLVSDLLLLAKSQEQQPDVFAEDFNVSQEITDAVLPFDALAFENEKLIITDIVPNLNYHGNKQAINKIVNILIDNAVKYTPKNGKIFVSLVKDGKNLVLTVKNDGSNVPDQDSNKIFERFYRAEDSRSREFGGSGLGLAIAKNLCDINKWKIFAISKQGVSMQITVVI